MSVLLPEDGPLKYETCWSDTVLTKWFEECKCALVGFLCEIVTSCYHVP